VDAFAEGKDLIGEDTLGGIKSVYLAGKADKSTLPSNLEIGKADLQKLFIRLTNE
jgi:ABC-2 type transport system ATP-binding protein